MPHNSLSQLPRIKPEPTDEGVEVVQKQEIVSNEEMAVRVRGLTVLKFWEKVGEFLKERAINKEILEKLARSEDRIHYISMIYFEILKYEKIPSDDERDFKQISIAIEIINFIVNLSTRLHFSVENSVRFSLEVLDRESPGVSATASAVQELLGSHFLGTSENAESGSPTGFGEVSPDMQKILDGIVNLLRRDAEEQNGTTQNNVNLLRIETLADASAGHGDLFSPAVSTDYTVLDQNLNQILGPGDSDAVVQLGNEEVTTNAERRSWSRWVDFTNLLRGSFFSRKNVGITLGAKIAEMKSNKVKKDEFLTDMNVRLAPVFAKMPSAVAVFMEEIFHPEKIKYSKSYKPKNDISKAEQDERYQLGAQEEKKYLAQVLADNPGKDEVEEFDRDRTYLEIATDKILKLFGEVLEHNLDLEDQLRVAYPFPRQEVPGWQWRQEFLKLKVKQVVEDIIGPKRHMYDQNMLNFLQNSGLDAKARAFVFINYLFSKLLPEKSQYSYNLKRSRFGYLDLDALIGIPDSIVGDLDSENVTVESVKRGLVKLLAWYCSGDVNKFSGDGVLFDLSQLPYAGAEGLDEEITKEIVTFVNTWAKYVAGSVNTEVTLGYLVNMLREFSRKYILYKRSELVGLNWSDDVPLVSSKRSAGTLGNNNLIPGRISSWPRKAATVAALLATLGWGATKMTPISDENEQPNASSAAIVNDVNRLVTELDENKHKDFTRFLTDMDAEQIKNLNAWSWRKIFSGSTLNTKGNRIAMLVGGQSGFWKRGLSKEVILGLPNFREFYNTLSAAEKAEVRRRIGARLNDFQ